MLTVKADSVTLTNDPDKLNFDTGETVAFHCTSAGGLPDPTVELLRSGVVMASGPAGTTVSDSFTVEGKMDRMPMVCRAVNAAGTVATTKTITVSSELIFCFVLLGGMGVEAGDCCFILERCLLLVHKRVTIQTTNAIKDVAKRGTYSTYRVIRGSLHKSYCQEGVV